MLIAILFVLVFIQVSLVCSTVHFVAEIMQQNMKETQFQQVMLTLKKCFAKLQKDDPHKFYISGGLRTTY